jgi:hypothetical protein
MEAGLPQALKRVVKPRADRSAEALRHPKAISQFDCMGRRSPLDIGQA